MKTLITVLLLLTHTRGVYAETNYGDGYRNYFQQRRIEQQVELQRRQQEEMLRLQRQEVQQQQMLLELQQRQNQQNLWYPQGLPRWDE